MAGSALCRKLVFRPVGRSQSHTVARADRCSESLGGAQPAREPLAFVRLHYRASRREPAADAEPDDLQLGLAPSSWLYTRRTTASSPAGTLPLKPRGSYFQM